MDNTATQSAPATIEYTLTLTVKRAIRPDTDETVNETASWMASAEAKRELEREVLKALRKLDGDCDVEVIDLAISGLEVNPRERGDDDGIEYADQRDYRESR